MDQTQIVPTQFNLNFNILITYLEITCLFTNKV